MSRVSFINSFSRPTRHLLQNTSKLQKSMEKISTGKQLLKASDNPPDLARLFSFQNETDRIDQYKRNIDSARGELESSEATLNQVNDLIQQVRELAVQSVNDSYTAGDRELIAAEIDQRLEELVDLANTRFGDKFLFGGTETQSLEQLFAVERDNQGRITDVEYRGDLNSKPRQVGDNERINSNLPGHQVFQATNQRIAGGFGFDPENQLDIPMADTALAKTKNHFLINETKIYYDTGEDSIIDLAERINEKQIRAEAVFVDSDDREYSPQQALTTDPDDISGNLRFALRSQSPHQIYLRDFDRQPDNGSTIDGLLNDLEIVGENGAQPALKERQNYPITLHGNSTVEGKDLFRVFIDFRDSLLGNPPPDVDDPQEGIQQSIEDLDAGLNNLLVQRSIGGARLNRLDLSANRVEDREIQTKELISKIEDANLAEVIGEYERQRLVQEASLSVTSNIMGLSLVNFL